MANYHAIIILLALWFQPPLWAFACGMLGQHVCPSFAQGYITSSVNHTCQSCRGTKELRTNQDKKQNNNKKTQTEPKSLGSLLIWDSLLYVLWSVLLLNKSVVFVHSICFCVSIEISPLRTEELRNPPAANIKTALVGGRSWP